MPNSRQSLLSPLLLAVCLSLSLLASQGGAMGAGLRIHSDLDRLPADGKTQVAITLEVMDGQGVPAPDGTRVHFATTLGKVVSPVQTVGGLAQTVLTAANTPGVAIVSAMVGSSRASLQVEFLAQPGSAVPGSRLVELSAEDLSYSADQRVFIAMEKADLRCGSLQITADGLEYDMDRNLVCAQGNVAAQAEGRIVFADAMRYDLVTMRGDLLRLGENAERLVVEGKDLEEKPAPEADPRLWGPMDTGDTRTWVKARRAIIDPGQKVILDHATFYVNDAPIISLRRHVLDPSLGAAVFGQTLGYSSASGMRVDFPWYYRASANREGSLHVTRNRTLNGYGDETGWALGLREEYLRGDDVSGAFMLDDLANPRRGLHWEHRQPIGGSGRLSLEAGASTFEENEPRFRSGSLNYAQPASAGTLSLMLSGMEYGGSQQSYGDLTYRFREVKASTHVGLTPSLHLRHSRAQNSGNDVLVDTGTGEPLVMEGQATTRNTSVGTDLSFHAPAARLSSRTDLIAGLTTGYFKTLGGGSQSVLDFRLSLDHAFGVRNQATLTYTYSGHPSAGQASLFSAARQMLTLSTGLHVEGCAVRANASQEIGGSRQYGSLSLSRPLPFGLDGQGRPLWSLQFSHFATRVGEFSAAHTRLSLSRAVGRFRASLCYSPQGVGDFDSRPWISAYGYGYTYTGGQHLWLELSAAMQ